MDQSFEARKTQNGCVNAGFSLGHGGRQRSLHPVQTWLPDGARGSVFPAGWRVCIAPPTAALGTGFAILPCDRRYMCVSLKLTSY